MWLPILCMFLGEAIIIFAENYAAKNANIGRTLLQWFFLVGLCLVSGLSLIMAYKYGYKYRDNIRIVVALSIGSIVFVEPVVSWMMFGELPTNGAIIGGLLGFAGMVIAMFGK